MKYYIIGALLVANLGFTGFSYAKNLEATHQVNDNVTTLPSADSISSLISSAVPSDLATQSDVDEACLR